MLHASYATNNDIHLALSLLVFVVYRLAVDNSSHLSERDRSPLLEYPLHRIGSKFPPVLQSSVLSGINGSTACVGPLEDQDSGGSCEQPDGYEGSRMECSDEEIECQPAKRVRVVSSKRGRWGGEGSDMAEQAGRDIAEGLTGETSTLEKHSLAETITREVSGGSHITEFSVCIYYHY